MLKNKITWNQMKLIPLHPSRRVDSGHSSNGYCMRNLSHSDRFPNHAKSQQSTRKKSMMTSARCHHVDVASLHMETECTMTWKKMGMLTR
jgi:hypothetical protein